jgi:predicted site-specific integrase-resolvase
MYLKPTDAAKELGVSRQWVYHLIDRGSLNTTEIAGIRLIVQDGQFHAVKRGRKHDARKRAK